MGVCPPGQALLLWPMSQTPSGRSSLWPTSASSSFGQRFETPDRHLSILGRLLNGPKKRKIFVSYHSDRDQAYYDTLAQMCDDCEFLQDNSVDRLIKSDDVEYQERRIREDYVQGTSATVVLCGLETYQ